VEPVPVEPVPVEPVPVLPVPGTTLPVWPSVVPVPPPAVVPVAEPSAASAAFDRTFSGRRAPHAVAIKPATMSKATARGVRI
jgi:hypothetical protein